MRLRTPTKSSAATAAALLLFITELAAASGAVLGIDLGQEFIKAALVKPGIPLEIVLTKDTKRKEASAIGFKPSSDPTKEGEFNFPERLYGADAVALAARFPHDVYPNLKQLLGKSVYDDLVATYSGRYPALSLLPSELGSTATFKTESAPTGKFLVEQLIAMQLKAVVVQAQALAGPNSGKIRDVVFTVPAFFTAEEKRALTTAAELAELKVMSMVTDGLAVGINYATTRTFDEKVPEYHIVYDMGAGSTTATVLKFQGMSVKDVGRFNKTVQDVQVLGVGYDTTLGGDLFNQKVVDLLLTDFTESTKGKNALEGVADPKKAVRTNGRAAAKLWREATRSRQILSANTDTIASVESLYEDVDFRSGKITRAAFEESLLELAPRITDPIFDALAKAKITLDQVNSIIVHGGAVRTPFVGKKLEEIMGGPDKISKNVNSDEAAVFGATFKGAGESGSFKVKDIRTHDVNPYPVSVKYRRDSASEKDTSQQIFPAGSSPASQKIAGFPHKGDFEFSLVHNLPPRLNDPKQRPGTEELLLVKTENVTESIKKLTGTVGCPENDITAKFSLYLSKNTGIPTVGKGWVECTVEVLPEPEKKEGEGIVDGVKGLFGFGKKKDDEQASESSASASSSSSSSSKSKKSKSTSTSSAAASSGTADAEPKLIKKTERIPVKFTVSPLGFPQLPAQAKKDMIAEIKSFDVHDASRRALEETRNELEAFTYKARELLTEESFVAASPSNIREKYSALLEEAGDWLYGDGFHASLDDVKSKFKALKDIHNPIMSRRYEHAQRDEKVSSLREAVDQTKTLIKALTDVAPPVKDATDELDDTVPEPPKEAIYTPEEIAGLVKSFEDVEQWLETQVAAQAKLDLSIDPVLTVKEIEAKMKDMNKVVMDMVQKKMKAAEKEAKEKARIEKEAAKKKAEEEKAAKKAAKEAAAKEAASEGETPAEESPEATKEEAKEDVKDEL
ncbi:Hsp70 protein-domain-containing protein [Geopyxis carbonaria]|nr:Hsp70 protein-domain-containing protein [Geopyxis carbonaria]